MTLDEMLAREAIRHTLSIYNNAGDRGRIDEMVGTFTPDGGMEYPDGTARHGRAEIAAYLQALATDRIKQIPAGQPLPMLRHHLTTCRIEFTSPTEANAWTYILVVTEDGPDHTGMYIDRFVQAGDRWLIQLRRAKMDWAAETSWYRAHLRPTAKHP